MRFALTQLKGRLHEAVGDKRCGCAPCAYWVAMAARSAGVDRRRLEAQLPPPAKPERRRRRPAAMRVRVCASGTFRTRGADADTQQGLAVLLSRLHVGE
jgi:hypothetical protein